MSRAFVLALAGLLLASALALPALPAGTDAGVAAHTPPSPAPGGSNGSTAAVREAEDAMVVNANPDELLPACDEIAGERTITVRAGRAHAEGGEMFAYDADEFRVAPCTRLTVTLINEDHVRHQWMVHGLPRETYPMGMFTIEVTGPGTATGTFVVPGEPGSLRVHCSLPQHEQKGMRADLVVGSPERTTTGATTVPAGGIALLAGAAAAAGLVAWRHARSDQTEATNHE